MNFKVFYFVRIMKLYKPLEVGKSELSYIWVEKLLPHQV